MIELTAEQRAYVRTGRMRELRDRLRDTSPRATEPPESRAQLAKGQPPKGGPSASLITMHREGIKKSIHGKACEMQTTNTYLGLLRERGKQGLPLARVYRQLFNKNLYLTAYGKIYRNAGSMTKGSTSETVDSMSLQKIRGHHSSFTLATVPVATGTQNLHSKAEWEKASPGPARLER